MSLRAVALAMAVFIVVLFFLVLLSNDLVLTTNRSPAAPRHGIVPHPPALPASHHCNRDKDSRDHDDHDRDHHRENRDDCHKQKAREVET